MRMYIAEQLLAKGAEITLPLRFHKDRAKVSGAMWGGALELKLDRVIYGFEMWYHLSEERDMTKEEVLNELGLRRVRCLDHTSPELGFFRNSEPGVSYDAHWYTVVTTNKVLLCREGYFTNEKTKGLVDSARRKLRYQNQGNFTEQDEQELLDNGFEVLITFDSVLT